MRCKIIIPPPQVVLDHFIERFADGCSRRVEHPSAFGAAPPLKTLFIEPYQFALHSHLSTPFDLLWLWFERNSNNNNPSFYCPERHNEYGRVPKPLVFEYTKSEVNTRGLNINDRKRLLSVGYPTLLTIYYFNPRSSSNC